MDNKTYEISSAEWEVMNIIWMKKYASANNIYRRNTNAKGLESKNHSYTYNEIV
ncbi:methicillin resistance regulatory protein mecI [Staphylococcus aureus M0715]|nr:methicillin resistance regulatory protein mecI [Staphylococcus aureus M1311]EUE82456.1 methicillin resistance regulatory protein mecI [Staphylococcus aureus M0690]EUF20737.1 methicillin resistance regulatory protein mecI [Staphylococcus aureus M0715]EUH25199.1 methicillin resistance regulatory protein mecI [Staphylococcus aureus M0745]EUH55829.1 methicillin resistance regulatory protein mecI [Staphylococcus aureus M0896]EVJ81121.1 methicillin resistance regulatory protein mecI [Staphylococc